MAHHVVTPDWQGTKAPLLSPSRVGGGVDAPCPSPPLPRLPGAPVFFLPAAGLPRLGLPGEPCPGGLAPKAVAQDVQGWGSLEKITGTLA